MKKPRHVAVGVLQGVTDLEHETCCKKMREEIQFALVVQAMLIPRERHDAERVVTAATATRPHMRRVTQTTTTDDAGLAFDACPLGGAGCESSALLHGSRKLCGAGRLILLLRPSRCAERILYLPIPGIQKLTNRTADRARTEGLHKRHIPLRHQSTRNRRR